MYTYTLVWKDIQFILFKSQFRFLTEADCLHHYEIGLARKLFYLDRSRINQLWTNLALWGLIGRIHSVELVRVLCAFGCDIAIDHPNENHALIKSFSPVTYMIPITAGEQPHYKHLYHGTLGSDPCDHIPFFLELSDKLVIGSYYTTVRVDADSQFPIFCNLLETDMCLERGCIRQSLFELFNEGFSIMSDDGVTCRVLAKKDDERDVIYGDQSEQTLFYITDVNQITSKIS